MLRQLTLPDVGEGLVEGDIVTWHVKAGDEVHDGQIVVDVETAKAAVELPCPFDGVVTSILAEAGSTVPVGTPIMSVETAAANGSADAAEPAGEPERRPNLVGYGPRAGSATRRRRRAAPAAAESPAAESPGTGSPAAVSPAPESTTPRSPAPATAEPVASPAPERTPGGAGPALAKPPVRKLAKDLGVDLAALTGTGTGGVITRADVEAGAAAATATAPAAVAGAEQRIAVKGVRKHMAAAMVSSAFTAPHASEFLTLDMTETMRLRDRVAARREFSGVKVTPLLFVAKAVLLAARRNPMVNSTWDAEREEIVLKPQVNLGIAAATERGLVVPNIKSADRLSLLELARALVDLTETARAGHTSPADLAGGTLSITNVGVFGIDSGTPILPPGETVIVAVGAVRDMPWVVDGAVVPRKVAQLSLSFDHRVIDGAQASMFLADVGAVLSDPGMALL